MNDAMIRDIVEQVMSQLGGGTSVVTPKRSRQEVAAPSPAAKPAPSMIVRGGNKGVFADPAKACEAAHQAHLKLREAGLAARKKVVDIVKTLSTQNAEEWGRIELDETKIGRLDHKIEKLQIVKLVPGVEWLRPDGRSGDHGITLEEYTPFGVIAAVTPSTHSIPTLSGNVINMVAAGNAVVFNTHPSATQCAKVAVNAYNDAIERETGIANLVCMIETPTVESFTGICTHALTRLICVTGGPGVVAAAMKTGKRAICAGPGNPPVVVAEDACPTLAAQKIILGASYDNNLLCTGEKEVFVVDSMADALMAAMEKNGAVRLNAAQIDKLTKEVFTFKEGEGVGCAHATLNKKFVGMDAAQLAKAAGVNVSSGIQLLFGETNLQHAFVQEEQMTPFLPIVRVRDVDQAIEYSLQAEHNFRHTSMIHTHNVNYMTKMARAMDTTIFVKNGPCMAGLGLGGEGYLSYTVATPTGEGVTNPRTFTRTRRCVMVDNLRIY
ncbi:aldehyde dehydrogenase EutE [Candidatus Sumerlaeota bacterium]|nr:aldehyde dehydrogenase EutE [Candidatus Sumerlaeota bacterium]